jgi:hypothetical protein
MSVCPPPFSLTHTLSPVSLPIRTLSSRALPAQSLGRHEDSGGRQIHDHLLRRTLPLHRYTDTVDSSILSLRESLAAVGLHRSMTPSVRLGLARAPGGDRVHHADTARPARVVLCLGSGVGTACQHGHFVPCPIIPCQIMSGPCCVGPFIRSSIPASCDACLNRAAAGTATGHGREVFAGSPFIMRGNNYI